MSVLRLSDEAKSRILANVKNSAQSQKKPISIRKITAVAAVLCVGVLSAVLIIRFSQSFPSVESNNASESASRTAQQTEQAANPDKSIIRNDPAKQGVLPWRNAEKTETPYEASGVSRPADSLINNDPEAPQNEPAAQEGSVTPGEAKTDPYPGEQRGAMPDEWFVTEGQTQPEVYYYNSICVDKKLYEQLQSEGDNKAVYHVSVSCTDKEYEYNGTKLKDIELEMNKLKEQYCVLWYLSAMIENEINGTQTNLRTVPDKIKNEANSLKGDYKTADGYDTEKLKKALYACEDDLTELSKLYNTAYNSCQKEHIRQLLPELDSKGIEYSLVNGTDCELVVTSEQLTALDAEKTAFFCFTLME